MGWKMIATTGAEADALQEEFYLLWGALGAPKDAAIYTQLYPPGGPTVMFFSPAAAEIMPAALERHAATDCPAPADGTVSLFIGDDAAKLPSFHA